MELEEIIISQLVFRTHFIYNTKCVVNFNPVERTNSNYLPHNSHEKCQTV